VLLQRVDRPLGAPKCVLSLRSNSGINVPFKAYLNPNGLKYHVEKGTCTFEDAGLDSSEGDANASDVMEEQRSASTSASAEPLSPAADPGSPHQSSAVSDEDPTSGLEDIATPLNSQLEISDIHDSSALMVSVAHWTWGEHVLISYKVIC